MNMKGVLAFRLIVSPDQMGAHNAYFHRSTDVGYLHGVITTFDNLRDFVLTTSCVISNLGDEGWNTHLWGETHCPDSTTVDLSRIRSSIAR